MKNLKISDDLHLKISVKAANLSKKKGELADLLIEAALTLPIEILKEAEKVRLEKNPKKIRKKRTKKNPEGF